MGTGTIPKVWTDQENLTNEDLNDNFQELIDLQSPSGTDGLSEDVAQMQLQTSPGDLGSENLATSLQGELERLRFQISQVIGKTFWYQQPSISLETVAGAFGIQAFLNRVVSGETRTNGFPAYLRAAGSGLGITLKCDVTPFRCYIKGELFEQSSNLTVNMVAALGTNNTMTVNDTGLAGGEVSKWYGELYTVAQTSYALNFDAVGSNIVALDGRFATFRNGTEYITGFLKRAISGQAILVDCKRGAFFDSTFAPLESQTIADNGTFTLMRTAWVFYRNVADVGSIFVSYDEPSYGAVAPTTLNVGYMWLDTSANIWKRFDGVQFVDYDCTFIGVAVADTTNAVATRPVEFFASYSENNTCKISTVYGGGAIQIYPNGTISVSGKVIQTGPSGTVVGSTDVDPDSGAFPALTSVNGFLYMFNNGQALISTIAPNYRPEMYGFYHPYANARCLSYFIWNGFTGELEDKFFGFSPENDISSGGAGIVTSYNVAGNSTFQTIFSAKMMWTGKDVNILFNGSNAGGGFLRLTTALGPHSMLYRMRISSLDGSAEVMNRQGALSLAATNVTVQEVSLTSFNTVISKSAIDYGSVVPISPFTQILVEFQVNCNSDNTVFVQNSTMRCIENIGRVF